MRKFRITYIDMNNHLRVVIVPGYNLQDIVRDGHADAQPLMSILLSIEMIPTPPE